MSFRADINYALELDQTDPLKDFRQRFHLPREASGEESIYFCGNSLGLQPANVAEYLDQELDDWRRLGVKGHFNAHHPWMPYHELLAGKTATLAGAQSDEVVTMNSLTTNLHLMMVSFYRPTKSRYKILIEKPAFPSDRYAVESQIRFHGYDPETALIELGPGTDDSTIDEASLKELIAKHGDSIALILLPGVQYYSGQLFDMAEIARLGHEYGCMVGFDLAHAMGNVPLELHAWGADFAVWCNYKYMNAGPGAVGGCFVHARHADNDSLPRFAGWWGHDKQTRFKMGPKYVPMHGAEGWQLSNPPILALAPVLASLEIFDAAGMPALREKSVRLTGYLEYLIRERLGSQVQIITPPQPEKRGCQLSLRITQAGRSGRDVFAHLEKNAVVCDWREPDVIRVAPTPLYNCFTEVFRFVDILRAGMD